MSTTAVFVLSLLLATVCATCRDGADQAAPGRVGAYLNPPRNDEPMCVVHNITSPVPPQGLCDIDTRMHLYTRKSARQGWAIEWEEGSDLNLTGLDYEGKRQTIFVVHGLLQKGDDALVLELKDGLLYKEDANVFVVDWHRGAGNSKPYHVYDRASANTRLVGKTVARFAGQLISLYGSTPRLMHGIGFGLGAQVLGHVGQNLPDLGRITGLDPAMPCFEGLELNEQLDASDARRVDIVHTTFRRPTPTDMNLTIGYRRPGGHVDFFFSSTSAAGEQPGCNIAANLPAHAGQPTVERGRCSHEYAYKVFTASLLLQYNVWACQEGYSPVDRKADPEKCVEFGYNAFGSAARGSFYLNSTADYPYLVTEPNSE